MEKSTNASLLQGVLSGILGRLSDSEVEEVCAALTRDSISRGFTYLRGGVIEPMNLMLVPSFFTVEQAGYLTQVSLAVKRGVEAAFRAWFDDERIASLLPFEEDEERWLRELRKGPFLSSEPLWYRLDAHFHMKEPDWRERISIFEINGCAVGGIHYSPVADGLFLDDILPVLRSRLPYLPALEKNPDSRSLLLGMLVAHAKATGAKTLNVVYSEDTTAEDGITEGPYIVEFLRRAGVKADLADPRELCVRRGRLYFKDTPVDVVYRNFELRDVIEMEADGDDVEGVRFAFSNNMAVSSLCGDFDHKSMWEVLGSGRFDRYFRSADAALLKKHLLWTRTVAEGRTVGPEGLEIDLVDYANENRESLVLKPNRLCGGHGVTIGRDTAGSEWTALIETALKEPHGWVVQSFGAPEVFSFPSFENGRLETSPHNIVYGLSSTPEGSCILGRVSVEDVVNVARHGGLMPVLRAGKGTS